VSRDRIRRPTEFVEGVYLNHATTTLTGATTLTVSSPMIQFLDPGGADRTVTLPAEASSDGLAFHFYNSADADETLTINDDAAATIATLGRGQAATLICDGTSWIDFSGGGEGGRAEVNVQTLAATLTLTAASAYFQSLDPGGADRTVTLPAVAASIGLAYSIINTGNALENLTVKNAGATAQVTIGPAESAIVVSDGVAWKFLTSGRAGAINSETLAATKVITMAEPTTHLLNPDGAVRIVTLPTEVLALGMPITITNTAATNFLLTVNEDSDTTLLASLGPNQTGVFLSDGTNWHVSFPGDVRDAINVETLAATRVILTSDPAIHHLDPGGASRTVTLPTEVAGMGYPITVKNTADADEKLNVYEDTDTTIQAVVGAGMTGVFRSDGTSWHVSFPGDIRGAVNIETLAGTHVLTATSPKFQTLDPGGAGRDVTLPVAAIALTGLEFRIANAANAAEALTVKDTSTIVVIDQNEIGILWCDGVTWQGG